VDAAPATAADPRQALAFGPFVLDAAAARLTREGVALDLPPRPFALLCHLAGLPGALVTKDALLDAVWGHRHVSESVLKGTINTLRAALGDDARAPQWIETVPRRGYRFIATPRTPQGTAAPGNLPPAGTALIGRAAELEALPAMLSQHRLVTLAGCGGVGKTRLALAAAAQAAPGAYIDGVWLVRLDALCDGDPLVASVARALGLPASAARDVQALAVALAGARLLLVLDNCEHLIDAVAALVQTLLAHGPGVRVLATSQEPLHIQGEQVLRIAPLACPPTAERAQAERFGAVALFVQRVRALDPAFELDDANRQAVCDICQTLDGLPLALELAAARVPLLGVHGVRERLAQRLQLLTHGARDALPRHRTLRATLAWSHGLLSGPERVVLRRLAVFAGSFSLPSAQAVLADEALDEWGVLAALGALVDKSLLVSVPDGSTAHAALPARRRRRGEPPATRTAAPVPRLRMFDSIQGFALEQLDAAGELETLRTRHLQWMLSVMQQAHARMHDEPMLAWCAALQPETDQLRAALRHALRSDAPAAVALCAYSEAFWRRSGLKHEAQRWFEAVRPLLAPGVTPALAPALRAAFAQAQAALCVFGFVGERDEAEAALLLARQTHHALGDPLGEYYDLYLYIQLLTHMGRPQERPAAVRQLLALVQPGWSLLRLRYARLAPSQDLRAQGELGAFHQLWADELACMRDAGCHHGVWSATYGLALAEHDRGDAARAQALLSTAVQEIRTARRLREYPMLVSLLAALRLQAGDLPAGLAELREAVDVLRMEGTLWSLSLALPFAPLWRGRAEDAARVLGWADATLARRSERPGALFTRLRSTIHTRLLQDLASDALQAGLAHGALLGEEQALTLALGD
jgi:predicted ATPase/DNA-binding winged helix-turn-helix (wHTH) protein